MESRHCAKIEKAGYKLTQFGGEIDFFDAASLVEYAETVQREEDQK